MTIHINAQSKIPAIAARITCNSDIWADEVDSVTSALVALLADAEQYGCTFTRQISDCWGGSVQVTAHPITRKHEWSF